MRSFAAEQTSPSAKFSRGLRTATLRNEILNDNRVLNASHIRRRASAAFAKKLTVWIFIWSSSRSIQLLFSSLSFDGRLLDVDNTVVSLELNSSDF